MVNMLRCNIKCTKQRMEFFYLEVIGRPRPLVRNQDENLASTVCLALRTSYALNQLYCTIETASMLRICIYETLFLNNAKYNHGMCKYRRTILEKSKVHY